MKQVIPKNLTQVALRWQSGETYWAILKPDEIYNAVEAEENCYKIYVKRCYEVPDPEEKFPCITLCAGVIMLFPRSWFNEVNEYGQIM